MLVKNWMSTQVVTIDANDSMQEAMRLMKEHHIRRLPVMQQGRPFHGHWVPGHWSFGPLVSRPERQRRLRAHAD